MKFFLKLDGKDNAEIVQVGGKGLSLNLLAREGFAIPETHCLTSNAYKKFISKNNLNSRIQLELSRKDIADCRWEELWDISLRIRNLFLRSVLPDSVRIELKDIFNKYYMNSLLAVRSSSTVEDSSCNSFAGLHESFIAVKGLQELENKVILVWASLWSDATLSYRNELKLRVTDSKMAVLIQPMLNGRSSGVCFSQGPLKQNQATIEAVYGLNQGLVDGKIEPDRWLVSREDGRFIDYQPADKSLKMSPEENSLKLVKLSNKEKQAAPLTDDEVKQVYDLSRKAESYYGLPQDIEWTFIGNNIFLLQSRPITTIKKPDPHNNRKEWDLSLKRSFSNLCQLQEQIEGYLTQMETEGKALLAESLKGITSGELVNEYNLRLKALKQWTKVYWDVFIPYGHGMRLFGEVYNEVMMPSDPYEFVTVLQAQQNIAGKRNNELKNLADIIAKYPENLLAIKKKEYSNLTPEVNRQIKLLVDDFAMPAKLLEPDPKDSFTRKFFNFVAGQDLSKDSNAPQNFMQKISRLESSFLQKFPTGKERKRAQKLLELGRNSFLMRDNDNVYLNRFKDAHEVCVNEIRHRLSQNDPGNIARYSEEDLLKKLADPSFKPNFKFSAKAKCQSGLNTNMQRRQIVGQPAGPGFGFGLARVIEKAEDIFDLQKGEIIICDAIGPEMTFAVPIAGGIVERRGGMLIHGAIIAREYGIPCVTGIPDATSIIKTGSRVSVDGHLGIVTLTID